LRWLVTTAAIEGETLQLEVAAQEHGAARVVPLDLASLQQKEPDAAFFDIGLQGAWSRPVIEEVVAGGPAEKAGLQKGDVLLSIDGQAAQDGAQARAAIRASGASGRVAQAWGCGACGPASEPAVQPEIVPGKEASSNGTCERLYWQPARDGAGAPWLSGWLEPVCTRPGSCPP
jgi:regulator of sigma E protease